VGYNMERGRQVAKGRSLRPKKWRFWDFQFGWGQWGMVSGRGIQSEYKSPDRLYRHSKTTQNIIVIV